MIIWPKTPKLSLWSMSHAIFNLNDSFGRAKSSANMSPLPRMAETNGQWQPGYPARMPNDLMPAIVRTPGAVNGLEKQCQAAGIDVGTFQFSGSKGR